MADAFLALATSLQVVAIGYGVYLLQRRSSAAGAWSCLLGAMGTMLAWRLFVLSGRHPPDYFNPLIAICGSVCMLAAMVLFAREVARRERAEAERDASLASERTARADAERAIRLRDDFLATLSHELRTPLAAILSWCAVLRRTASSEVGISRGVDTIERNARLQARLVDDLLDATRIQAGTLQLDPALIRLDIPVLAAVEAMRPAADAKGLSLRVICDAEPAIVDGDSGRLQQVASNLLANAVKFTPHGGRIDFRAVRRGNDVVVSVADTGEGIDPQSLPFVFEPFWQNSSSPGATRGLGLGLAVARKLVELHGGTLTAASEGAGLGATFEAVFPIAGPDNVEDGSTNAAGVESALSFRRERA